MTKDNKKFGEELKKRIYDWILRTIKFLESLPRNDELCKIIIRQLMRSATSVGANYIEAVAGSSRKDFTNFLLHSLKSSNESKFWLALLRDSQRGNADEINILLKELTEISNILGSSIKTLRMK